MRLTETKGPSPMALDFAGEKGLETRTPGRFARTPVCPDESSITNLPKSRHIRQHPRTSVVTSMRRPRDPFAGGPRASERVKGIRKKNCA